MLNTSTIGENAVSQDLFFLKTAADEIHSLSLKATPITTDVLLIEDSADSWNKKRIPVSSIAVPDPATFTDITISNLSRNFVTYHGDTKIATGIPFIERGKFKVAATYGSPNVTATISFVGANTSFSYYINGKKFTVTATELAAYTASASAAEGTWYFYIDSTTTAAGSPVMGLTQNPWLIYNPDVLLWNFYFNATANTITWIGEERHTAGRDIFNHARNHAQGAIYKSGLTFSQYNGLTNLSGNTNDNFGRAMTQIAGGAFFDEDILNTITHTDASISATVASPATDWNLTVNQFLGFTALATTGTNATTIVFTTTRTLVTGQAITVMNGNTTTVRGTTTISSGGTGTSFTVASLTGLASGDAIVVSARIPIYYISGVAGGVYTWRKLTTTDFLGVTGGAAYTPSTIASGAAQYNNAAAGGFSSMTANRYYPMYLLVTNSTCEPVIAILGQGQSTSGTLSTALGESPFQFANLLGLANLGLQEVVPFYRLTFIYNTTAAFTNTRIKLVDATFINVRVSTATGVVLGSSVTSLAASMVYTDTTNFGNVLSTADTSVQAALDTIDNMAADITIHGLAVGLGAGSVASNTAFGTAALAANTTGADNTAIGNNALTLNTTGQKNTAVGSGALDANTSGTHNIAVGGNALGANTTGIYNTALGYSALSQNNTGSNNVAIGINALFGNIFGNYNVAIGSYSLYTSTIDNLTAVGYYALKSNTTGTANTAVGYYALKSNTTGTANTAVGFSVLSTNTTGQNNTAVGYYALQANTTGEGNTAIGDSALKVNTTGSSNVAVGYLSLGLNTTGKYNTGVGYDALGKNTFGNNNTALGYQAGNTITYGSNVMCLGYGAAASSATASNEITLGDSNVTNLRCYDTTITSPSDRRDKADIADMELGLEFIKALKPRKFKWDRREWYDNGVSDGSKKADEYTPGFIAQELQEVSALHGADYLKIVYESNPDRLEVAQLRTYIPLIKAVQELAAKVEALEAEIKSLKEP